MHRSLKYSHHGFNAQGILNSVSVCQPALQIKLLDEFNQGIWQPNRVADYSHEIVHRDHLLRSGWSGALICDRNPPSDAVSVSISSNAVGFTATKCFSA